MLHFRRDTSVGTTQWNASTFRQTGYRVPEVDQLHG